MPLTVESSGPRDLTTRSRWELARSMTVTAPSSYFRATAHPNLLQPPLFRLLEHAWSGWGGLLGLGSTTNCRLVAWCLSGSARIVLTDCLEFRIAPPRRPTVRRGAAKIHMNCGMFF